MVNRHHLHFKRAHIYWFSLFHYSVLSFFDKICVFLCYFGKASSCVLIEGERFTARAEFRKASSSRFFHTLQDDPCFFCTIYGDILPQKMDVSCMIHVCMAQKESIRTPFLSIFPHVSEVVFPVDSRHFREEVELKEVFQRSTLPRLQKLTEICANS